MIIKVNFGSESSSTPDGFITDSGAGYSSNQGFGWVTQDSLGSENATPIDISNNIRDRQADIGSTEDTLIHLQYPENLVSPLAATSVKTPAAWEYDIANGSYFVTVGVGDSEFTDSSHTVNIEGESAISGFSPTEDNLFSEATKLVEVTDGRLTIDAVGGENTKLNFVEITAEEDFDGEETSVDTDESEDTEDTETEASLDTEDFEDTEGTDTEDSDTEASLDTDESEDTEDSGDTEDTDTEASLDTDESGDTEDTDTEASLDTDESGETEGTDTEDSDTEASLDTDESGETEDTDTEASLDTDESGDTSDVDNISDSGGDAGAIRVNFGTASAFPVEGYIQDIGSEYNDGQGYGWVTQDSVGSGNPTSINITPNTRDRNSVQEDTFDSLIHLQYADAFDNQNSVKTPAAWEYELANGEYTVTVGVGDPDFIDSNHVINIEGNSVISGFVPTEDNLFEVQTSTVQVTDGKLTIDAIGGENTKLNFVEITPADGSEITNPPVDVTPIETPTEVPIPVEGGGVVETVQPIEGGINVNFGAATVDSPSGFTQDIGEAYSESQGYGWVTQDSAGSDAPNPIDLFANTRDRDTLFGDGQGGVFSEATKDSLIHLQYPTGLGNSDSSVTTPAAWEYALENGQYEVTVGVGDPDFFDSNHVINVEGESAISSFVPTGSIENGSLPLGAQAFSTGTVTVDVTDGRLTVDAIGGENTKLNYISIVPVSEDI